MKVTTRLGLGRDQCNLSFKLLFFRYYHVKIQSIVSIENPSHAIQQGLSSIKCTEDFYISLIV